MLTQVPALPRTKIAGGFLGPPVATDPEDLAMKPGAWGHLRAHTGSVRGIDLCTGYGPRKHGGYNADGGL